MNLLPFLARHWQGALGLAAVAILSVLLAVRTDQRDDARRARAECEQARLLFTERVRAKAEEAARIFQENARRVEAEQDRISQEVSRDYQDRIAELRTRVERLRADADRTRAGGAGGAALPGLPGAAGGSDGPACPAGLPAEDAILATEQAIRLDALQRWVRRQQEAER